MLYANCRERDWCRDQSWDDELEHKRPRAQILYKYVCSHCLLFVALTNIIGLPGNQATLESDHFDGIQADLKYIVDESQKGCEGKRCHKYGSEAELDHWGEKKNSFLFYILIMNYSCL